MRSRAASDFIGKAREKSRRVSASFRSRTFATQNAARCVSPFMACIAAAIIAISTCAPGERAPSSAQCAASTSSPKTVVRERTGREHRVVQRIERAQPHREIDVPPRIEGLPRQSFGPRTCVNSLRVVRADRGRALEPPETAVEIALEPIGATHREAHERIQRIELEPTLGEAARVADRAGGVARVAHECRLKVDERQTGVSASERGIEHDCALKQIGGRGVVDRD